MSVYKYYIDEVINIIKEYGFELLSEEFVDSLEKLTLKDKDGYFYRSNLANIKQGCNPSRFGNNNPFTRDNIVLWLKLNRDFLELISDKCENTRQKLIFKDNEGFLYYTNFENIQIVSRPRKFHKSNPFTIQNIKLWLRINNMPEFKLISDQYKNNSNYLTFVDNNGYFYTSGWNNILQGRKPRKFDKNNIYSINNIKLWLKLNNNNFELLDEKYTGSHSRITLKDHEGFLYFVELANLIQGCDASKFHEANPFTINNIKLWLKNNHKEFKLMSDVYEGNDKYLKWQCLTESCGELFEATWATISQECGCPYCVGHKVGLSNCLATLNPDLAKEWHSTKNGSLTPYDITCGSGKDIWWQCSKNPKHEWQETIRNRRKEIGCPYCSGSRASEDYNLLVDNPVLCEEWDYKKNNKNPDEYTPKSGEKVYWICKKCENKWYARIADRNNGRGCPECSESKGEKRIENYLINNYWNKIIQEDFNNLFSDYKYSLKHFIPQKTFDGLVGLGNGLLSYDFYLPQYNLLIEYQGEYHDGTVSNQTQEEFEKQQEHDRRKKEYALKNKYNLLEIWYWDFDNIETILEEYLSKLDSINI